MQPPNVEQAKAALNAAVAISEAIREAGEIPSGTLYAMVMAHMSFASYEAVIDALVRAKLVTSQAQLLRWVGPTLEG